jgi:hypothetical protein
MNNDPLANLTRNQKHILDFVFIQHKNFLRHRHKESDCKIVRAMLAYCKLKEVDQDEISFLLTTVKLNVFDFIGIEAIVAYYRRRKLGVLNYIVSQ